MEKPEEQNKMLLCRRLEKMASATDTKCLDPAAYCKWRTSCPVYMQEKENARASREPA